MRSSGLVDQIYCQWESTERRDFESGLIHEFGGGGVSASDVFVRDARPSDAGPAGRSRPSRA